MKRIKATLAVILFIYVGYCYLPSNKKKEDPVTELPRNVFLPNLNVHIFYDGWFRNPDFDSVYQGWGFVNKTSDTLGSAYYPNQGLYSSNDPKVVDVHMKYIRYAGAGVVVVSWWPETHDHSPPMVLILNCAQKYDLKVTIHVQNYPNRTMGSIIRNLVEVLNKYGKHHAFYKARVLHRRRLLPMIYIYESLSIKPTTWNKVLSRNSNFTIRGTPYDAFFIGLIVKETDKYLVENSDFDGFYTLLSHPKHNSHASTWFNWPYIQDFARERQLIFIPTVSPGYDYRLSTENVKPELIPPLTNRKLGIFYKQAWARAVISRSKYVSINSFNGWMTATQIEPARENANINDDKKEKAYEDYSPGEKEEYLQITRRWIIEFANRSLYRKS